jgi:ribonuclease BN (tRNA processing enzyme)
MNPSHSLPIRTFTTITLSLLSILLLPGLCVAETDCHAPGIHLQVLGSGGPELDDRRASSGYLVWQDGRARVLVDMGAGSLLRFEQAGARIEDLEAVLLTHLHVDHSADLPALVKASFFTGRTRDLPVYGPTGNRLMPATDAFLRALFGADRGAFRYLGSYLTGQDDYRLYAVNVSAEAKGKREAFERAGLRFSAVPVHHGPLPALAWRVDIADKSLAFSGDMNGDYHNLEALAGDADLLVAHHAIPQAARGVARNLHMPPAVIGRIAKEAGVKQLVLSHRMNRTLGKEVESERIIREHYAGPLVFAEDGGCFSMAGNGAAWRASMQNTGFGYQ